MYTQIKTPADLGTMIRARRRALGIATLEEFALMTGHSVRFLSEVERGKEGAAIGTVMQLATKLGIDLFARER